MFHALRTYQSCNSGFSLDEEYMACFIECVGSGSTDPTILQRSKIRRVLADKPALRNQIENARIDDSGGTSFHVETERVHRVALKLAAVHSAFELNEPQFDPPQSISIFPLITLSDQQRKRFEMYQTPSVHPEVGSRAMQRLIEWPAV